MLVRLEITDFAIISHIVFEPENGLNVISGETGAGKSLLIDAIGLIMGNKASKNLIRHDCNKASVEAVFTLSDREVDSVTETLSDNGIEIEDGQLIVLREIFQDGRSSARINGRGVNLSVLSSVVNGLIDIHGQHDNQRIFDEKTHVYLLDKFGGSEVSDALNEYTEILNEYKRTVLKIRDLGASPEKLQKRREYLEFAYERISEAGFKAGEEEELRLKKKNIMQASSINECLSSAEQLLSSDTDSVKEKLFTAVSSLNRLVKIDESYKDLTARLNSCYYELESVTDEISLELNKTDYSEQELNDIDNRLSLLYDLKSKYGDSIEEINDFMKSAEKEISEIDNNGKVLDELRAERVKIEKRLLESSRKLSDIRKINAAKLGELIVKELSELEIPSARFDVEFAERSKEKYFSSYGTEDIRFVFSANPGESLKPLSKIVSGGEASRIMLAVKKILSGADETPTLIFDEIDTGISGAASIAVATKLKSISKKHQVLCVSHTAQIAACSDCSWFLKKESDLVSSYAYINKLDENSKITEVSRLLSGTASEESINLAKNLIESFSDI